MAVTGLYSPLMARQADRWVVESRTTRGTYYEVFPMPRGGFRCTCPAGQNGRGCWHATAVEAEARAQAELLAAEENAAEAAAARAANAAKYHELFGYAD